jgi:hypothetical protein
LRARREHVTDRAHRERERSEEHCKFSARRFEIDPGGSHESRGSAP